jgi:hypothetical protein
MKRMYLALAILGLLAIPISSCTTTITAPPITITNTTKEVSTVTATQTTTVSTTLTITETVTPSSETSAATVNLSAEEAAFALVFNQNAKGFNVSCDQLDKLLADPKSTERGTQAWKDEVMVPLVFINSLYDDSFNLNGPVSMSALQNGYMEVMKQYWLISWEIYDSVIATAKDDANFHIQNANEMITDARVIQSQMYGDAKETWARLSLPGYPLLVAGCKILPLL